MERSLAFLLGAVALSAAACTSQEEQIAVSTISTICAVGPVVVSIATGAGQIATLSNVAGQACGTFISQVQAAIDKVTAAGGTATVTVVQGTTGTAQSSRRFAVRRGAGGLIVKDMSTAQTFVIPPGGLVRLF